ncbi:hypothetical protein [Nocardioides speluncae]|uniref:hypothetical protein n=1 Tax=Nocardioides speluncae TaxID=2670337 RepID=UPI0012B18098|nr:hypothetical protein [Nocardioides speluncae]
MRITRTRVNPAAGGGHVWRVRLRVGCQGDPPYEVGTRRVPKVGYSGPELGSVWPVFVDREDLQHVEVDWAGM